MLINLKTLVNIRVGNLHGEEEANKGPKTLIISGHFLYPHAIPSFCFWLRLHSYFRQSLKPIASNAITGDELTATVSPRQTMIISTKESQDLRRVMGVLFLTRFICS